MVRNPSQDEEQVRQPVQIPHDVGVHALNSCQGHDSPLGSAADGPRQMQSRRGRRSSRQNKAVEWLQGLIQPIDRVLEPFHLRSSHPETLTGLLSFRLGYTKIGTDIEKVVLDGAEERGLENIGGTCYDEAKDGIQLVHVADDLDAGMVLGNAGAVAEPGLAPVT